MMGPASNPRAVVDPELRVHGVSGLRVADASIMPTVVSGNTNAACIMIGEKCADLMLAARSARGDWRRKLPASGAPQVLNVPLRHKAAS